MATATPTTASTTCIRRQDISSPALIGRRNCFDNFVNFPTKTRRFVIRSSGDATAETTTAPTEAEIEVQKGLPSLISALNLEKAIRGIPITEIDYYGVLGLQQGCSYDSVTVAYKNKLEELMNKGSDQDEISKDLELLKEAYTILSSEEERRLYDWSIARSGNPDKYTWPYEVDITQASTSTDIPPPVQVAL